MQKTLCDEFTLKNLQILPQKASFVVNCWLAMEGLTQEEKHFQDREEVDNENDDDEDNDDSIPLYVSQNYTISSEVHRVNANKYDVYVRLKDQETQLDRKHVLFEDISYSEAEIFTALIYEEAAHTAAYHGRPLPEKKPPAPSSIFPYVMSTQQIMIPYCGNPDAIDNANGDVDLPEDKYLMQRVDMDELRKAGMLQEAWDMLRDYAVDLDEEDEDDVVYELAVSQFYAVSTKNIEFNMFGRGNDKKPIRLENEENLHLPTDWSIIAVGVYDSVTIGYVESFEKTREIMKALDDHIIKPRQALDPKAFRDDADYCTHHSRWKNMKTNWDVCSKSNDAFPSLTYLKLN